jgi:hypothetical protein
MAERISSDTPESSREPGVMKLLGDERAALADDLAAARELYRTFDPDSPPWSVEPEMRRLESRWAALRDNRRAAA